ncbi:MAG: TatD family nuclease-associated radical SAM protein, partial [Methermicoccaceae archaeon]
VDAISISLNAEDAPHYEEICHPTIPDSYKELLELTAGCRDVGIDVRLTVVGTCNIDIEACRHIAETFGVGFHIR